MTRARAVALAKVRNWDRLRGPLDDTHLTTLPHVTHTYKAVPLGMGRVRVRVRVKASRCCVAPAMALRHGPNPNPNCNLHSAHDWSKPWYLQTGVALVFYAVALH